MTNVTLQCLHLKTNFVLQADSPLRQFEKSTSGQSFAEVLLISYVCPHVIVSDESDITLFTF